MKHSNKKVLLCNVVVTLPFLGAWCGALVAEANAAEECLPGTAYLKDKDDFAT